MIETMFGSGSPMWTATPSMGLAFQPMGVGGGPIGMPLYSAPMIGGGSSASQGLSVPGAPQQLAGQGLAAYPFAPNPSTVAIGPDTTGFVTPSSLLAAVAMRRGQPQGPTNDHEVEELIYDVLDLIPGAAEVDVRCESGRATLSGIVHHRRTKRDVGEIAWAIPGLQDVQNNVSIASRRRARASGREAEAAASVPARKQG